MASTRPLSTAAEPLVRLKPIQAFCTAKDKKPMTLLSVPSIWRPRPTRILSRGWNLQTFTHPSTTAWVGTGLSSTVAGSRS
ncbi:hypothetical protein KVT40_005422 [Elsinoe batatas]|uniref:Uncharacterized protein n=1 Tax=Elsinoe batatas TaxID=2601811 RepID=A0A8K0PFD8_9PEZI|nr:hypothetical protein KVT40_005422 [Elsinoe batatas]